MDALVVYESMYGNTHAVGDAIAEGLSPAFRARVVSVDEATPDAVAAADLVVVGGPTHVHGMASARTRASAREQVANGGTDLRLDPSADGAGLDAWLPALAPRQGAAAAAFDTRMSGPRWITGRAGPRIARGLRGRGYRLVVEPESFIVDRSTRLVAGEVERARRWAADLASAVTGQG